MAIAVRTVRVRVSGRNLAALIVWNLMQGP